MRSPISSSKYQVRVLASLCGADQRTTMSRTIDGHGVQDGHGGCYEPQLKSNMKYSHVPEEEEWRVGCLDELLNDQLEIAGFNANELKDIVSFICSS